ncbi:MAG: hypothetical protein AAF561_14745 [Planctomycetota bacterium]
MLANDAEKSIAVGMFLVAFAVTSALMAWLGTGFLEADGITHFLYARAAWDYPWVLTDVWGRPIVKLLHILPAGASDVGVALVLVRWTSLVVVLVGAALAWVAAKRTPTLRPVELVVPVLVLGSPLVFLHSFAVLTELPYGVLMLVCLIAYQRKWWWLLALVGGLLPAARPEGIGFVLMIATGLLLHRRWLELPLLTFGTLSWATTGWLIASGEGVWPIAALQWLRDAFPYSEESVYDAGPLLKFVGMLPAATGPMLFPLVFVGAWVFCQSWRGWRTDHDTRVGLIIVAVPAIVLVVHSLLHWTGKMASSGDVRYLVAVWPFWGLLAARGLAWLVERGTIRQPAWVAVGLAAGPMILLQLAYPILPIREDADAQAARRVAAWVASDDAADLLATHPDVRVDHPVYRLAAGTDPFVGGSRDLVREPPPGVLFLWHEVYSNYNADARFTVDATMPEKHGWSDVTPDEFPGAWRVFVSPESIAGTE